MQTGLNLSSAFNILINPINVYYQCYDCHFIINLKNHPEIEAVEAMVMRENSGNPMIRAIVTRHDKTQADFINYDVRYEDNDGKKYRNIRRTRIEFSKTRVGKRIRIYMKFRTDRGEEVMLRLNTVSQATAKHCKLIDPAGHSADSALPVMIPERNTIASSDSSVSVNGVRYGSPVKIWIPLFFKAVDGYYSEKFHMGVFRAGVEDRMLLKAPETPDVGESWVYRVMDREIKYTVSEINNDMIRVTRWPETVMLQKKGENLIWLETGYRHKTSAGHSSGMNIRFTPGLVMPGPGSQTDNSTSEFSISMNDSIPLVKGTIKACLQNGITVLGLEPEEPAWAREKPVTIRIAGEGNRFHIKTSIGRLKN